MICEICNLQVDDSQAENHLLCHFANGEVARRTTPTGKIEFYKAIPAVINQSWLRLTCHEIALDEFLAL